MASSSMALRRIASGILRPRGGVTLSAFAPAAATRSSFGSRQFCTSSPSNSSLTMTRGRGRKITMFEQVKFTDNHYVAYTTPLRGIGTTGKIKQDMEGLYLKVDMPGLAKEDVTVYIDDHELTILGQQGTDKKDVDGHFHTMYYGTVLLNPELYDPVGIKAEMKHGQLNITIPRIQEPPVFVRVV